MKISLALILDELGFEAEVTVPDAPYPKFETVELFVPGETIFSPTKLLVCPLTEALAAESSESAYFLCLRDRPGDFDNEYAMQGISVVRGNVGLRELFNHVLRVFVKMTQWIMAMEQSVSKRNGLKDLLHISEPIFGNFITI